MREYITRRITFWGLWAELNLATVRQRWGSLWTGYQSITGPHNHTLVHTHSQPMKHVFGVKEIAKMLGENPHMLEGNMQISRGRVQAGI